VLYLWCIHCANELLKSVFPVLKADTISSRPASRLGGVNTTGMNKLEARKMQMLTNQRKELEEELLVLEDEILNAVQKNIDRNSFRD